MIQNRSNDLKTLNSVLLFESTELDGNSTTVTLTSRRRERILTRLKRHRKLLHLGPSGCPDGCAVCREVKQRIRQVHKPRLGKPRPNPTPNYNNVPGHTIHMDTCSAYWDVTSLEGSNYTVQAVDSCSAYRILRRVSQRTTQCDDSRCGQVHRVRTLQSRAQLS